MNLEKHPCREVSLLKCSLDIYHGKLDHIRRSTLYRHIHRFPLGYGSDRFIGIGETGNDAFSPKGRLDISVFSSFLQKMRIIRLNRMIFLKKCLNIRIRFPRSGTESFRESESSDPINHPKIHTLRDASLFTRYHMILSEEELCRLHMDIVSTSESSKKCLIS